MQTRGSKNSFRLREAVPYASRRMDDDELVFNVLDCSGASRVNVVVEFGNIEDEAGGTLVWEMHDESNEDEEVYIPLNPPQVVLFDASRAEKYLVLGAPASSVKMRCVMTRGGKSALRSAHYILGELWTTDVEDGPEYVAA